jgi:hypothetical protein
MINSSRILPTLAFAGSTFAGNDTTKTVPVMLRPYSAA